MPIRARLTPTLLLAGLLASPAAGAGAGWVGKDGAGAARRAGYLLGDATPALLLRCAGPRRLSLVVAGGTDLPRDADYTVVVSVDDVAFIREARQEPSAQGALVSVAPFEAFAPLIAALK